MENVEENKGILIGAKVDPKFAEKFRDFCKKENFNQRALFYNLTRWWLAQEPLIQWQIYRGNLQDILLQNAAEQISAIKENQEKLTLDALCARLFQLDCDLEDVEISKDKKQVRSLKSEKKQVMQKISNLQVELEERAKALRKTRVREKEELARAITTRSSPPAKPLKPL